ncbi:MAG: glycosyltransferase family 4 protein [Pseudomonadota bacterium]
MPKKARILHLHSTFDHGGKEDRAVRLMNAMGKRVDHVVVSAVSGALGARKAIAKTVTASFPDDFPSLSGRPGLGRYYKLAQAMKPFDLVLTYNWGAMDAVMAHTLFAGHFKLPQLVHHEDGFNADEAHGLKRNRNWFRMVALGRTNALVVPSRRLESIAYNDWSQPSSRVHRIPNGIDVKAYAKRPGARAIPSLVKEKDELVIGTLAGLRPVKNLPLLVRVAARSKHRDRLKLVIVGDGPERGRIKAEAEKQGIADRLVMPGFLSNPERYVGLFDIFALTSDSEQFPISLVEAMAAGKAALATNVGDVRSIVAEPNQHFLSDAGDEKGLAVALDQMLDDSSLRAEIGAANMARAREDYDRAEMIARYGEVYNRASGRSVLPENS